MITTITMNPCMDKTIAVDEFAYGELNRIEVVRIDPSGKGINVSQVLKNLGIESRSLGIVFADGADEYLKCLKKRGIEYEYLKTEGKLRENIKLLDKKNRITTELNERGGRLGEKEQIEFEKILMSALDETNVLVVTGSVPPGVDPDYYRKLIEKANKKGIKCILDAESKLFLEGLKAKPYIVKPNLYELMDAFDLKNDSRDDLISACKEIVLGDLCEIVCLSMGEKGAVIVDKRDVYSYSPRNVDVKSTQGAGDSLVAGMCIGIEERLPLKEMFRYAIAAAEGSLVREGTLLCTREQFEENLNNIEIV